MSDLPTKFLSKESLLSKDRIGAMIFMLACLCYGYQTTLIPLFPGDEYEPFTARTLPILLTFIGIGLSLILLITGQPDKKSHMRHYAAELETAYWLLGVNGSIRCWADLSWLCFSNQLLLTCRLLPTG